MRHRTLALLAAAHLALPGVAAAISVGQPAPDFLVENCNTNQGLSMSEHAGKIVVLVFFAHW